MDNNIIDATYRNHLEKCLDSKRTAAINQAGSSDLEDENYITNINVWYDQLLSFTENNPPTEYVNLLIVFEDNSRTIDHIEYYYQSNGNFEDVSLCIKKI